ncbi:isopentenyl-diphosphate Delta-isomerase [Microbacterium oxydans]|uniref:Isopentenyl-diphosphate Delta-isomerase n=1 Tax=Microbacterium oxydans TaxID=82380 RepID=A0A0F0L7S5_9MICO|nr:isopentenyl-diphosphate Delta-isomerase [Microbacterium oxydans]KJL28744.1 Isopentenyl-diphosphate Delta-isomerase [Microbacterium oxydans]
MDHVTLLAEDGSAVGTFPKDQVHTFETPLHLAFSCHIRDRAGRILVTRRALAKQTWPGVWTNSFCGHPRPGEDMIDAVRRRAAHELGIELDEVTLALPEYRYRAVDASGIVENEICPVHVAVVDADPVANPDEVAEWAWAEPDELVDAVTAAPFAFSPWLREQLPLLRAIGEV